MRTYRIVVLPGDGIGPEVMREALKVLNGALPESNGPRVAYSEHPLGADNYRKTGEILSDGTDRGMQKIRCGSVGRHRAAGRPAAGRNRGSAAPGRRSAQGLGSVCGGSPNQALRRSALSFERTSARVSTSLYCGKTPRGFLRPSAAAALSMIRRLPTR